MLDLKHVKTTNVNIWQTILNDEIIIRIYTLYISTNFYFYTTTRTSDLEISKRKSLYNGPDGCSNLPPFYEVHKNFKWSFRGKLAR